MPRTKRSYPQWCRDLDVAPPPVASSALPCDPPPGGQVRGWAAQPDGTLWAAMLDGTLWVRRGEAWACVIPGRSPYALPLRKEGHAGDLAGADPALAAWVVSRVRAYAFPDADVRAVAVDAAGTLWLATAAGLVVGDGGGAWYVFSAADGLPYADVRGVVAAADGSVWCWFARAVARLHRGRWRVFAGTRWLPDGDVQGLLVEDEGAAWAHAAEGWARLYARHVTLGEKAAHYEAQIAARHERHGYVADCRLERAGDLSSAVRYATDNDGLWTAMYLAAESYCCAVTGDAQARERARRAARALLMLQEATPIAGYPARALVWDGEDVRRSDPERGEWHRFVLPDGRSGQWKGDTSSDEIVGHVYGLSIYYDLLAEGEERAEVGAALVRIADHVLDHGYCLVDLDGAPTTWGVWAPEDLNGDLYRLGDRGLNALELLALLRTVHHVSGCERYLDAYRDLVARHGYALNVIDQRHDVPGHVNHSDDELAYLSYYPLLRYEDDPALCALYLRGLERAWQLERPEACPLWNWIYGALTGRHCDAGAAREALAEIPLDLINYPVDATDRLDVDLRSYRDRHGRAQAERPLPWLERPLMKWNGNPYCLEGGDGRAEEAGTFYLLAYWMGRYYGFLE